jgi:hypothetical protein
MRRPRESPGRVHGSAISHSRHDPDRRRSPPVPAAHPANDEARGDRGTEHARDEADARARAGIVPAELVLLDRPSLSRTSRLIAFRLTPPSILSHAFRLLDGIVRRCLVREQRQDDIRVCHGWDSLAIRRCLGDRSACLVTEPSLCASGPQTMVRHAGRGSSPREGGSSGPACWPSIIVVSGFAARGAQPQPGLSVVLPGTSRAGVIGSVEAARPRL